MKKLSSILLAALTLAATVSCNKENEQVVPAKSDKVTVLTVWSDNNVASKTTLDGVNVLWASTDVVTAFDLEKNNITSTNTEVMNTEGTIAKFSFLGENLVYALYPANEAAEMDDDGVITTVLPSEQAAVAGSFADGANLAIANIVDVDNIHFKNVGGLLAFKVKETSHSIVSATISGTEANGGAMTGDILVEIDSKDVVTSMCEGKDYVKVEGAIEVGNTYYAVVAPGTYKDVTITFTDENGATATYTKKTDLDVERNSNQLIGGFDIPETRWVSAPFFYESFDKTEGTGGNDDQWSGTIASSTLTPDNEGWTFESAGGAYQCAKFGTSKAKGSALSPALNITSDLATLTFKAGAWNKDATTLLLSLEGNGVLSESSVTMVNNAWTEYTVYIAAADKDTKIKFYTEGASRFFLDEIKVVEGGETFEYLSVPSEVSVAYSETSASFEISTSSAWTISGADDVEIDKTSGTGNATVTLTFPANNTASDITIATLTVTAGEKSATVVVKQLGNPNAIEELTVAEFLAKEVGDPYYRLTGTVTNLTSTEYGNFTLVDESGSVLVYGLTKTKVTSNDKSFASIGLEEGDVVTLEGKRSAYNDTPQVGGPAYYISHVKAPSLVVEPTTLVFVSGGESKTATATAKNFTGDVTISAESSNAQFTASVSGSTITIVAAENTDDEVKSGTITVTATDGTNTKTAEIAVSQNKPVQPAKDGDVLWQEDFTGYGTALPASATGDHVYGAGTVTYSVVNGGSETKLYDAALATGATPEILIGKSNGSFTVSGIPTGNATAATLTFKLNYDYATITPSAGVTVRDGATFEDKVKTVVLDIAAGTSTFNVEFKNTNSSNCRADDFKIVVGAPKVKQTQTISFGSTKTVEWILGTDCELNAEKQGLTVSGAMTTVTYSSSNPAVASVDNNGVVTPLKAGTVILTATAEEDNDYKSATDSYSLTIVDPNSSEQTQTTHVSYDLSFDTIGSTGWSNSYASHTVFNDEATVQFASHSKQTSTVTDVPVGKGAAVTLVLKKGTMTSVKFVCKQWGTKAQTITLHYSTDGGSTFTSTGVTSTNFTILSDNLPVGTNAAKITFSSTSNQVGVSSVEFDHVTVVE